jgi:hypothetical protein
MPTVAGQIGGGLIARVCDLCGGVDDHPRHVIAGQQPDTYAAPHGDIIRKVLTATADLPQAEQDHLLGDLVDTTSSDRHLDCCAAAGCPTDTCGPQVATAKGKTGKAMMSHLMSLDDLFADRPEVVQGLTAEQVAASLSGSPLKAVRAITSLMLAQLMLAAVGLSAVNLANAWLNVVSGTTFTGAAGSFIQLHTSAGDPGAAGTSNASSVTTRPAATWAAASAGSKAITTTLPSWTSWAGTSPEVVAYVSDWSASSAGTFYLSVALTANKTVQTADTLTLNTLSVALSPIAA